jgi:hypothetical protein
MYVLPLTEVHGQEVNYEEAAREHNNVASPDGQRQHRQAEIQRKDDLIQWQSGEATTTAEFSALEMNDLKVHQGQIGGTCCFSPLRRLGN